MRMRNQMAPGTEGGWTTYLPTNEVMTMFDASLRYEDDGTPLAVLASKDYGMGSSRDWAAGRCIFWASGWSLPKVTSAFYPSNLVGMGVP
ncbi:MAG: hypothetical protein IPM76_18460 [Chloroflexi bacterium]|nr:hypothetical protein [Chloroflexota bacterium]